MLSVFLDFINRNKLISHGDRTLLAVSGGIDSMVMTHLFHKAGFEFAVAHCNFGLRGAESDGDEESVRVLAKDKGVPFYSKCFETKKYATDNGVSTQMAARDLRYAWFDELLKKNHYTNVATAHHLNDSIETVLFNLTRGSGISGVTGIASRNGAIIRPLLFAGKDEIVAYAKVNNIYWREDFSNLSDDYNRNLIRHNVIPLLRQINPNLEQTFVNTQTRLSGAAAVLKEKLEDFKKKHTHKAGPDFVIDKEALAAQHTVLIDELVKSFGFNYTQVVNIKNTLNKSGKVFESEHYELNIDREQVIISPARRSMDSEETMEEMESFDNLYFHLEPEKTEKGLLLKGGEGASFDYGKLKFPLHVRRWKEGDSFQPLGMRGKKKLSDFMIDSKIPLNLKKRVYVLESDGKVVWVIGQQVDDRFKVDDKTSLVYHFRLVYNESI